MADDLRGRYADALTAEHYRRARAQIVASPEEHSAAMADAVLAVRDEELERLRRDNHVVAERDALKVAIEERSPDDTTDGPRDLLFNEICELFRNPKHEWTLADELIALLARLGLLNSKAIRDEEMKRLRFEEKHLRAELSKCDAENNAAGRRAKKAEAERDALQGHLRFDFNEEPTPSEETPKAWHCRRCGSPKWVAASLTGPVSTGGRAIKQCVPCGYYSNDPVTEEADRG